MRKVVLNKEMIDVVFENASHQHDYLLGLYKLVIPEFDRISAVRSYPMVCKETSEYIYSIAITFDKEHHPGIFPGGCWINSGFGTSTEVVGWVVMVDETELVYL